MSDVIISINREFDFNNGAVKERLSPLLVKSDAYAHKINVACKRAGIDADLSDMTCHGLIVNSKRQSFTIDGTISGSIASLELTDACYAYQGPLLIVIKLFSSDSITRTTIFYAETAIQEGMSEIVIDPENKLPSPEDLIAEITTMKAASALVTKAVTQTAAELINKSPFEKVLIYYGYPVAINASWSVEGAANIYRDYDICVFGDTYQDPEHEVYSQTVSIIARLREISRMTRIVGYVPIGQDPNWPESNLTIAEVKARIDQWMAIGAHGIFLDEFGYDYSVTRARQNEIVAYCHDHDLFVFANSWSTEYVFSPEVVAVEWLPGFEPNPEGAAPLLNENDYYLYENLFYTTVDDGQGGVTVQCANVWRLDDVLRYFNEPRIDGESFYNHYSTKLCSLDAIPSTFDPIERQQLRSLSVIGAAVLNIHAVAFGDQNWGSDGYYEHWSLPTNLVLYGDGIHGVSVTAREYLDPNDEINTFPYRWSAVLGGQTWDIVFDILTPDDVTYVAGKRYAELNGGKIMNAWTTVFNFQSDVLKAIADAAQAIAICSSLTAEVQAILPTIQTQSSVLQDIIDSAEGDISDFIAQWQSDLNAAANTLEAAMLDLIQLAEGFNFKEVVW